MLQIIKVRDTEDLIKDEKVKYILEQNKLGFSLVERTDEKIIIKGGYIELTFELLEKVSKLFNSKYILIKNEHDQEGYCDTCGGKHITTLTIKNYKLS